MIMCDSFCGRPGDGIQLIGDLTTTSTSLGENVATLPDYPPEISPAGTVAGASDTGMLRCHWFTRQAIKPMRSWPSTQPPLR
jgi:hypothetical protein